MSLSAVVDVFIGLILVYLLLGMIGTSVQEALASWLNLRGECLRQGLKSLLTHEAGNGLGADWLYARVAGHSLIHPTGSSRHPSYVAASNFGTALVDGLLDGSQAPMFSQVESSIAKLPPGATRQALTALLIRAGGDLDQFQASVEKWFDDAMDRVSGVYKRLANNYMLIFGAVVALAGNIDTIDIAAALQRDPVLLQAALGRAQEIAQGPAPVEARAPDAAASVATAASANEAIAQARQRSAELAALNLPMGWTWQKFHAMAQPVALVAKLVGLIITALAVSLGAPFWFDLLQKVLNIRASGPKPAKSADPPDE